MKLRSAQERRERPKGSNVRGECGRGEASAPMEKRKRKMSTETVGDGEAEVSTSGEGVSGRRQTGKANREGKRLKEEVESGKGRNGKGRKKGNVPGDGGDSAGVSGSVNDVILRSRCTLRSMCALNGRLTPYQRDAVLGTVMRPVLEYGEMAMERHLTLALIRAWDRRRKAFRIAGREVPFSVFDVALITGLPGAGKKVKLDGEEVSTEVGEMVRVRMGEWEREEMARRVSKKSGKKRRFFKHYVNVMLELCEENGQEDRVGIWLKLYAFIVLSGVLFPRTPYGAAWSLLRYVDDVQGMGQYAWAAAVWQVVVDSIEDTQRKVRRGPFSEVQLNGLCLLIQVWFYEHTTIFSNQDGKRYPRFASWHKVDHGGMYDATELLAKLQESEVKPMLNPREGEVQEAVVQEYMHTNEYRFYVEDGEGVLSLEERLRRVRDAYVLEKEAHDRTRAEVELLKARVVELEERVMQSGAGQHPAGQGEDGAGGEPLSGGWRSGGPVEDIAAGGAEGDNGNCTGEGVHVQQSDGTEGEGQSGNEVLLDHAVSGCSQMSTVLTGEAAREASYQPEQTVEGEEDNQHAELRPDVEIGDSGVESGPQSVPNPVTAADGESISQEYDNVPGPDAEPAMAEKSPPAGEGGHTSAPLGKSNAAEDGPGSNSPPLSSMVSRLKKVPRVRKASRVRGSPYTDPTRRTKGGRRGPKSSTPLREAAGKSSEQVAEEVALNGNEALCVEPIAVEGPECDGGRTKQSDISAQEEVPHSSQTGSSASMPIPRTSGTGAQFLICEEGVKAYLTRPFSTKEVNLLAAVRARCKGLRDNQWNFDLPEAIGKPVNAEFLKGLINVVPSRGAGDNPSRYCIGAFAVNQYCELLHQRQRLHKRYCRISIFLDRHDQATLDTPDRASSRIWETVKVQKDVNLCQVFMPLFDSSSQHWLLLVANVNSRRFFVYDSLQCKRDAARQRLLSSAKVAIGLALTKLAEFTDVLQWEMETADCPQQENGHDCGVYMLMFMDILSIKTDGLLFGAPYVPHARDKLLLSCLQGSVAHFPEAFLEGT